MYVAIEAANDDVSPSISSMSQVFNPPPSGSDALSLIEEFLQPVFAMAMGPEFEKGNVVFKPCFGLLYLDKFYLSRWGFSCLIQRDLKLT